MPVEELCSQVRRPLLRLPLQPQIVLSLKPPFEYFLRPSDLPLPEWWQSRTSLEEFPPNRIPGYQLLSWHNIVAAALRQI